MLNVLIILLTIVMIVDCLFLILLVLVQLPKKDAGAGMAFGGGAADALFGSGSGNALTNLTKYSAGVFFVLAFALSIMNTHARRSTGTEFKKTFEQTSQTPVVAPPPVTSNTVATPKILGSNAPVSPLSIAPTNLEITPPSVPGATNPPAK
jgi:preprotein translocase subunit SecG